MFLVDFSTDPPQVLDLMKESNRCVEDSFKSQTQEKERKSPKSLIVDEAQDR
jgi:hypothetical protein